MLEDVKDEGSGKDEEEDDEEGLPEPEPEAALELEDGEADDDEELDKEDSDEEEPGSDQDSDLLAGEFAMPPAASGTTVGSRMDALPESLRKQASRLSKELLVTIPAEVSTTLVCNYRARLVYAFCLVDQ